MIIQRIYFNGHQHFNALTTNRADITVCFHHRSLCYCPEILGSNKSTVTSLHKKIVKLLGQEKVIDTVKRPISEHFGDRLKMFTNTVTVSCSLMGV